MVKDDRRTLRSGQDGESFPPDGEFGVRDCRSCGVAHTIGVIIDEWHLRVAVHRAGSIATKIERDRPHPRPKLEIAYAVLVVRSQRAIDANERVLSHVLGILPVASELQSPGVDTVLQRLHEIRERRVSIGRKSNRQIVKGCGHVTSKNPDGT